MSDDIPPRLLAEHPELAEIGQALEQARADQPITARCRHCSEPLVVSHLPGVTVVDCPCGRTHFRARHAR